ncbi:hypothetical protein HZH68_015222 [Vespula germanica]|uniref:Uncharacterized protein n=1 Tax=Vespula germanica TaxID=30212 RepID=A0A834J5H7_VESGE|nr:hypothetical protein HZH68_015222 [Vespula germanica]
MKIHKIEREILYKCLKKSPSYFLSCFTYFFLLSFYFVTVLSTIGDEPGGEQHFDVSSCYRFRSDEQSFSKVQWKQEQLGSLSYVLGKCIGILICKPRFQYKTSYQLAFSNGIFLPCACFTVYPKH